MPLVVNRLAAAMILGLTVVALLLSLGTLLFGDAAAIAAAKRAILLGVMILVPAVAILVGSAYRINGTDAQTTCVKLIAANTVINIFPLAIILDWLAAGAAFGATFIAVQGFELVASVLTIVLAARQLGFGLRVSDHLPPGAGATA
ncbi:MAG: hypothetical protein QF926_02855 [Alphaproteobacteria bacterium]|jgi:hypothetical protein|nr:hypothetical protein [Alphaproteobacteria bacterium]MDP6515550.1 hypothetical protein [Alphaproteobacteria bacterium]